MSRPSAPILPAWVGVKSVRNESRRPTSAKAAGSRSSPSSRPRRSRASSPTAAGSRRAGARSCRNRAIASASSSWSSRAAWRSCAPASRARSSIVVHTPGHFSGEMSILRGAGSLVLTRVREEGEVLALAPQELRAVVQTDSELSELLMRAFILRRVALIARRAATSSSSARGTRRGRCALQEFLTRNGHPLPEPRRRARRRGAGAARPLPRRASTTCPSSSAAARWCSRTRRNEELAECLGLNADARRGARARPRRDRRRARRGSPRRSTAPPRGSTCWCSRRARPAGRRARARRSRTTSAFPPASRARRSRAARSRRRRSSAPRCRSRSSAVRLQCDSAAVRRRDSPRATRSTRARSSSRAAREYRQLAIADLARFEGVGVYYARHRASRRSCAGARR